MPDQVSPALSPDEAQLLAVAFLALAGLDVSLRDLRRRCEAKSRWDTIRRQVLRSAVTR